MFALWYQDVGTATLGVLAGCCPMNCKVLRQTRPARQLGAGHPCARAPPSRRRAHTDPRNLLGQRSTAPALSPRTASHATPGNLLPQPFHPPTYPTLQHRPKPLTTSRTSACRIRRTWTATARQCRRCRQRWRPCGRTATSRPPWPPACTSPWRRAQWRLTSRTCCGRACGRHVCMGRCVHGGHRVGFQG